MSLASNTSSLAFASEVYACSGSVKIRRHWVQHPGLGDFALAVKSLERELGDEAGEEYWNYFTSRLERYVFLLSTVPLPSNHPAVYPPGLLEKLEEHLSRCSLLYPDFSEAAHDLVQQFRSLAACGANLLLDKLVEICQVVDQPVTALVLKEAYLARIVETVLSTEASLSHVKVVSTNHLRGETCYQSLLVLGAPRWYPEHVFSAARAREIHIASYDWIRDRWKPEPAFIGAQHLSTSTARLVKGFEQDSAGPAMEHTAGQLEAVEMLPEINLDEISQRFARQDEAGPGQEMIDARLFILEGGAAVFIDASENTKVHLIDLEDSAGNARVRSIPASYIEPGMFILLRTSGSGDYLIPIADKILGQHAQEVRESQKHWKSLLREKVTREGIFVTCIALLDLGSQRAEEVNVRNWMSSRNIRPHDKRDFEAIMKLTGLEDKTSEYWRNAKAIYSAHMKAGFHVRRLLLKRVTSTDLDELERTGRMDFELPGSDAGSLTAFRVLAVSGKTYSIPVSNAGDPFESEASLWQE